MARGDVFVDDQTTYRDTIRDKNRRVVNVSGTVLVDGPTYLFEKPDGTVFERIASIVTDGTDGQVEYTMEPEEQDQPGVWKRQIVIEFTNGTFRTEVKRQLVQQRLGDT